MLHQLQKWEAAKHKTEQKRHIENDEFDIQYVKVE